MKGRKKVLVHLSSPPIPVDGGLASRVLGFFKYFKDRRDVFSVEAVSNNFWQDKRWTLDKEDAVKDFVEKIHIYRGEDNLYDFLNSKCQSFYHQKFFRQQIPVDSTYYTPPGYIRFVENLLNRNGYDVILINLLNYAHLALNFNNTVTKTVIDIHDVGCYNRLANKNLPHLKNLKFDFNYNFEREKKLLNRFDLIIANSQFEIEILKSCISLNKLSLIPHIVDHHLDYSKLPPYRSRDFKYDLLFVGTGGHLPNIEGINFFLKYIFPKVVCEKPNVRLAIAGTVDKFIQIDPLYSQNINCLGYVTDLTQLYLQSKVVICPLLSGAGTKVKIQEAMSYGIPVVTTKIGASGMLLTDGINALISDDPDLFARNSLCLLEEPEFAERLSSEILRTFEKYYSNSAVYSELDRLFSILLDSD
jgi:glycosyltransferase involved in cell wall biosynthesis